MAVQAQYPSNALFLHRGVQEQHMQQPQSAGGGGFLDQITPMSFHNPAGGTNLRKRGREVSDLSPHLIDLTQIHSNNHHQQQTNVVSTGLRLAFGDQQRCQQQSISSQSSIVLSMLSDDLASQIKQQRDEIDQFLQSQGEQMRRTLAEKRHKHYRALLGALEDSAAKRLRDKEAEAEKAERRNTELEARAAQLSAEAHAWQARARAQEMTAASLQAQLQNAIMTRGGRRNENEGVENEEGVAEDAESGYVDPDRVESGIGPGCKSCRVRVASVVILPCRHLCLCTECDKILQTCPVCLSYRNSSVQVFL